MSARLKQNEHKRCTNGLFVSQILEKRFSLLTFAKLILRVFVQSVSRSKGQLSKAFND